MAEPLSANQGDSSYKHPTGAEVKRGMVEQLICLLLAGCAGTFISMQASANGSFRKNLGDPAFASFFSICGTFITACSLMLLYRPPVPSMAAIRSTPWWNWIGGPLGAMIVLSGAALIPRLGAAAFISAVVAGQLLSSVLLDHFALLGLEAKPITLWRVLGALMVVAGVACIKFS
jgi:transporter family-2 protein